MKYVDLNQVPVIRIPFFTLLYCKNVEDNLPKGFFSHTEYKKDNYFHEKEKKRTKTQLGDFLKGLKTIGTIKTQYCTLFHSY